LAAVANKHDATPAAESMNPTVTIAIAKPQWSSTVIMATTVDSIKSADITNGITRIDSIAPLAILSLRGGSYASLGSGNSSIRRGIGMAGRPSHDEPAVIFGVADALPKTPINESSGVELSSPTMPELPTNAR
jgi:hypothetical protein